MKKFLVSLVVLAVVATGAYYAYMQFVDGSAMVKTAAPYVLPELTQDYSNPGYGFALKMPADFAAQEASDPDTGVTTIVLQNPASDGVQIVISPFDEDTGESYTLTKERILQDIPDLGISEVQVVDIGDNYHGIAFLSDSDAFGGSSRAVWFVYRGNLYQINTYARLDNLLKAIFATWQFR